MILIGAQANNDGTLVRKGPENNVHVDTVGSRYNTHQYNPASYTAVAKIKRNSHCSDNEYVNTTNRRQNVRQFPDDIFKFIFLNENV